ncbi:hypothetical protein GE300_18265 [Rhodobacteraceae bacterium 2CG4]|uniref:Uncharacterized protein n=1 Tax=Halovulum marinum TaxID=2662447 RepID=A0A6L5Z529_9RHOB|nr:hypothetical protein [Halovulum marinum]MSU91527.1 hypothetical protein [Halovulum marinum]
MTAEFEQCRATARPQNKNRPAGGASHMPNPTDTHEPLTPTGQRGLIVAPPSGNTSEPDDREMRVLHKGFDTLAIAIRANIPSELFEYLETEKERADKERQDVLIEYNGVQLHLKAHGGNGYRFVASGGPFGANWFFKKPNSRDPWGIRVSFGSTFMANLGLAAARLHLDGVLAKFGIRHGEDDVSISRVDFCIDVLAPDFALIPENFVMHSSANRRDFVTAPEKTVHGKSGRITSVTIGSPRNRQVIVYDKRAEITKRGKDHWWRVWNDTLERQGIPPLDPKNPRNRVWRAEFRAGKDLLKDGWNIRTWTQLYERFGDLCRHSGEVVRYTDPSPTDPNRARWQNQLLWETVCAEMNADLCEMRSGCDPNPLKEVEREKHISLIFRGGSIPAE